MKIVFTVAALAIAFAAFVLLRRSEIAPTRGATTIEPEVSPDSRIERSTRSIDPNEPGPTRASVGDVANEPPAKPAPTPAKSALTVHVVDGHGNGVPGAELLLDDAQRAWPVGKTGAGGTLEIPSEVAAGASQLTATHPEFARTTSPILTSPGGAQTLVLHEGASIRGDVSWLAGGGPASDVPVFAIPTESSMPSSSYLARVATGMPSANATRTNKDGTFELHGLDKNRRYFVVAAWRGCFSRRAPAGIEPGRDPVRLELGRIFGVRIAYFDSITRAPIELPTGWIPGKGNSLRLPPKLGSPFPCHGRWTELAGISPEFTREEAATTSCFYFIENPDTAALGPIPYQVNVPGYGPAQGELFALPVDAQVPEHAVFLVPLGPRKTSHLRVAFRGAPIGLESGRSRVGPEGVLLLSGENGVQTLALNRLGPDVIEIDHLSHGSYRWRAVAHSVPGAFAYPSETPDAQLNLGPETDEIEIDLSGSGAIQVVLEQIDGTPYVGPVALEIADSPSGTEGGYAVANVRFDRAPYAIPGICAGNYVVRVLSPQTTDAARHDTDVLRGQSSIVRIPLR